MKDTPSLISGLGRSAGEGWTTYSSTLGLPLGSAGKESSCNVGDLGLVAGLGRSPGKGNGYPLQYSGLEISMDRIFHGVTKSQTRLSDVYFQPLHIVIFFFYMCGEKT